MRWTPEADLRLFSLTLSLHQVQVNYAKLAEAFGEGVTAKALVHRFDKIRRSGDGPTTKERGGGEDESLGIVDGLVGTPKKRKKQKVAESAMVVWTAENCQRLLAALVSAHPELKFKDYNEIAVLFGQGATYDSISHRFRHIRAEAKVLRAQAKPSATPPSPSRKRKSGAPTTPRKTAKPFRNAHTGTADIEREEMSG
ncbi:hypothetical protein HOY80DRAFT_1138717 [Tuber brumale]|nr:hypothetical protein HOY80DRAFT_1138717 [Tuber brumale]